jgi:hypothetical protein
MLVGMILGMIRDIIRLGIIAIRGITIHTIIHIIGGNHIIIIILIMDTAMVTDMAMDTVIIMAVAIVIVIM